jgi:hypothetical protein
MISVANMEQGKLSGRIPAHASHTPRIPTPPHARHRIHTTYTSHPHHFRLINNLDGRAVDPCIKRLFADRVDPRTATPCITDGLCATVFSKPERAFQSARTTARAVPRWIHELCSPGGLTCKFPLNGCLADGSQPMRSPRFLALHASAAHAGNQAMLWLLTCQRRRDITPVHSD